MKSTDAEILFWYQDESRIGRDTFLEAFREFQKDNKEYLGILMGKGKSQYFNRIKAYIEEYNLNVIIEEECHDIPALFNAADCVILPTLKYETFGRCGIEALVSNKLIIATTYNVSLPTGSYVEFHPFSARDLENRMRKLRKKLLTTKNLKKFEEIIREYSLEKYQENLLSFINIQWESDQDLNVILIV